VRRLTTGIADVRRAATTPRALATCLATRAVRIWSVSAVMCAQVVSGLFDLFDSRYFTFHVFCFGNKASRDMRLS